MILFGENNGMRISSVWSGDSSLGCEVYSAPESSLQTDAPQLYKVLPNGLQPEPQPMSLEVQIFVAGPEINSVVSPSLQSEVIVQIAK